eukprot:gene29997-36232_t
MEETKSRKRSHLKHIAYAVSQYKGYRDGTYNEPDLHQKDEKRLRETKVAFEYAISQSSIVQPIYDSILERVKDNSEMMEDHSAAPIETENSSRSRVYMDMAVDGKHRGRVVYELYDDILPITTENFRALCTGEKGFGYRNSRIHRIVKNFVVQGGDITKRNGTGGRSIYTGKPYADIFGNFKDEKFLPHSKEGLLSMANR